MAAYSRLSVRRYNEIPISSLLLRCTSLDNTRAMINGMFLLFAAEQNLPKKLEVTKEGTFALVDGTWSDIIGQLEFISNKVLQFYGIPDLVRIKLEHLREVIHNREVMLMETIHAIKKFIASPADHLFLPLPKRQKKKLIVLDLNGCLCDKTTKRIAGTFEKSLAFKSYHVVARPKYTWFLEQLSARGYSLGIYTSTPEDKAWPIIEFLDIVHLLEFVWYRNHCVNDPDKGRYETMKLLARVIESPSINPEGKYAIDGCIICDDTPDKIRDNPLDCQFYFPTFSAGKPDNADLEDVFTSLMRQIEVADEETPAVAESATPKPPVVE